MKLTTQLLYFFFVIGFLGCASFSTSSVYAKTHIATKASYLYPYESCNIVNTSFTAGEKLHYQVYYNLSAIWVTAGYADFSVTPSDFNGKPAYHLVCEGKSAKKFNWFYQVRDHYESYIDPVTVLPLRSSRDIQEGSFTKKNQFTFDHNRNVVNIDYQYRKGILQYKNQALDMEQCTRDILSAIYHIRSADYQNMKIGDIFPIEMCIDGEMYSAYLRYMGKEEVKTSFGKFRCAKFAPKLIEGDVFADSDSMYLWATDDENRLPILIESRLSIGAIKAYLTSYEGLKHAMESKIK